jgi:hypothetical protein
MHVRALEKGNISFQFSLSIFIFEKNIIFKNSKEKWYMLGQLESTDKITSIIKLTEKYGRGSERRQSERRQAKNFRTSKWSF